MQETLSKNYNIDVKAFWKEVNILLELYNKIILPCPKMHRLTHSHSWLYLKIASAFNTKFLFFDPVEILAHRPELLNFFKEEEGVPGIHIETRN